MKKDKLSLFGTNPYIEESIAILKIAANNSKIGGLREKLKQDILKTPGPGMRKRTAAEILRTYITYDRASGQVQETPLTVFASLSIQKKSKIDGLYYRFGQVHPIVPQVFRMLRAENMDEFSFNELSRLLSTILSREINKESTGLHTIAYALRDFSLVEKIRPGLFRIVEKTLSPEAFIFVLYTHFLSHNTIVPKTAEIKRLFKDLYNQDESETENILFSAPDGFFNIERNAHLDQVLFFYNNINNFIKKFIEVYGNRK